MKNNAKTFVILLFLLGLNVSSYAQSSKSKSNKNSDEQVFTIVEQMPQYPGGETEMIKFIQKELKYPESAKKEGKSGIVYITFLVDEKGVMQDIRLLRGVCEDIDKEAMRVVSLMPAWIPGKQNGKAVRVQYNLPVRFSLKETKSNK